MPDAHFFDRLSGGRIGNFDRAAASALSFPARSSTAHE
jgi:hypothetical protein